MIAGLSKAITLYLAPVLALTSILLSLFAYLAPTLLLHDRVALLTVVPYSSQPQTGSTQDVDGPSAFLGALGILVNLRQICMLHSYARFMHPPQKCCWFELHDSISFSSIRLVLLSSLNQFVNQITPYFLVDLNVLPSNAPNLLLSAPPASAPVFIAIAIAFSILFFILFTVISFRHKMGSKVAALLDKPLLPRASAWIGVFGFIIGE